MKKKDDDFQLLEGVPNRDDDYEDEDEGHEDVDGDTDEDADKKEILDLESSVSIEMERNRVSECFSAIGLSPLRYHSQPTSSKIKQGKRKIGIASNIITEKVARSLDVPIDIVQPREDDISRNIIKKSKDFDDMMLLLKQKLTSLKIYRLKIQVLTLVPQNWSNIKAATFFNVTEHMVRTAKRLASEKGVLSLPDPRKGQELPVETLQLVHIFYHDEEFTREMPGKKDCVSISRNKHMQKRLILCNLHELFTAFKLQNPLAKIGFSKFCSLRPKWCVLPGAPGTHSVCVCTAHQNTKLLLDPARLDYKDLMKMIVCDIENRDCMINRCEECPNDLKKLREIVKEGLGEFDENGIVQFSQWTTTGRSTLVIQQESIEEYVDLVVSSIEKLMSHSYIAKAQTKYLKHIKENLSKGKAIYLGDIAENYKFVAQDEVQGFHWNNDQCTLHPVVVYFDHENSLNHLSYCIISDDNNHDVSFVYEVQKRVINDLKSKISGLKTIEYFSDGCVAQYKNRYSFLNLCMHKKDFGVAAKWNFFATSHGKQPCDGIGGTVKRITSKASLQRSKSNHILDAYKMFEFCSNNINNIIFFFVKKEEVEETRLFMEDRFNGVKVVPGTRSFHQFVPQNETTIAVKRCSSDTEYEFMHDLYGRDNVVPITVALLDYVACMYGNKWWIGIILQKDTDDGDYHVKFMHPCGPMRSLHWPSKDDICWIPEIKLICKVNTPISVSGRRQQYILDKNDIDNIAKKILSFK